MCPHAAIKRLVRVFPNSLFLSAFPNFPYVHFAAEFVTFFTSTGPPRIYKTRGIAWLPLLTGISQNLDSFLPNTEHLCMPFLEFSRMCPIFWRFIKIGVRFHKKVPGEMPVTSKREEIPPLNFYMGKQKNDSTVGLHNWDPPSPNKRKDSRAAQIGTKKGE